MKPALAALLVSTAFLAISMGSGRSNLRAAGDPAPQFRLGADTYAELGKAPRPGPIRSKTIPTRPPRESCSFWITARNVTETTPGADEKARACGSRTSATPRRERCSGC